VGGATVNISCSTGTPAGRYLIIQLSKPDYLSLCEVEVYSLTVAAGADTTTTTLKTNTTPITNTTTVSSITTTKATTTTTTTRPTITTGPTTTTLATTTTLSTTKTVPTTTSTTTRTTSPIPAIAAISSGLTTNSFTTRGVAGMATQQ